ncbi:MAG TPA: VWA domain-containing protein [Thermoanaerobaculia bacterium]|nr:VWA domain-containing protein [Thermoanaerobaculia bacterium]
MSLPSPPRRFRRSAVLVLVLVALVPSGERAWGRSQDPPPPPAQPAPAPPGEPPSEERPAGEFGEELVVSEVVLDVLALDRKGDVVPGLGAEDFVVQQDGEPVEITSVTFYTTRYEDLGQAGTQPPREGAEAAPEQVPAARYLIYFFHDQTGTVDNPGALTRSRLEAARYARQWVREEMRGSDWLAVLRYDYDLSVHADFTQDQEALDGAIEEAILGKEPAAMRPSDRRRSVAAGGPSLLQELPNSFRMTRATERPYDAIRLVAEASGHIIGRKNLILFSLGFGQTGSMFRSPDPRYYPAMEEALNANNVAVYPIDLAGGSVDTPQTSFLSQLADDTGGELFKSFHSFLVPLRRVSGQTTGYYLLTFLTEHPAGESGYRKVEVDAKPRGVRVRARRGYRYGPG